ncbi:hypothetical protein [Blastococcus sp. TF02A-35]|uniref:hypothetical protein n=1 Tax=Blastococcus sp. TF02A-35 TaxID=2559612 RepID=UPI001073E2E0|nr:hypothetical protein [Blastococcus sp. TF02A_35]TFV53398.1 hypothetical protein E4P43_02345 [Blastococcus sp. TF02A_35]
MNAPAHPALTPVPSAGLPDEGLALVLELMAYEPAAPAPAADGGLIGRAQDWAQRAASWGEGPRGAWRAW